MINQATNYLPVQQAAVQQQIQQGQVPVATQATQTPKGPEYNAIKINIEKPSVNAPQDPVYSMPYAPIYSYPQAEQNPVFTPPLDAQPVVNKQADK